MPNQPSAYRPRLPRVVAALLAGGAAVALLAGCASTAQGGSVSSAPVTHPASGSAAAPTVVTTLDGRHLSVPNSKPTVLFFFSIGCSDCATEAKATADAARAAGPSATVVGVDLDPGVTSSDISSFLSSVGASQLPVTLDTGDQLATAYKIAALSTVIVVDPTGKVSYRATDPAAAAILAAVSRSATT